MNENGIIIPYEKLSMEVLNGLIEEFVTRDGTDTGYDKKSLPNDVESVKNQLEHRKAFIVYDQKAGTCNIIHKNDLKKSE